MDVVLTHGVGGVFLVTKRQGSREAKEKPNSLKELGLRSLFDALLRHRVHLSDNHHSLDGDRILREDPAEIDTGGEI